MSKAILKSWDKRLRAEKLPDGILRIQISSRLTRLIGLEVTCYLVDDVLIDTGFAHIRDLVVDFLADREINAICCTHNHEDHAGNCAVLGRKHDCPVFLASPDRLWGEGVERLPLYRRLWWGLPEAYQPLEMPERILGKGHTLRAVPTPGHSQTHVVLFDESGGNLFSGDLYITGGVTAIMTHENPYASVQSLRKVAALSPRRLLSGHGLILEGVEEKLHEKADRIEEAAGRVAAWHHDGMGEREILHRVFTNWRAKDWSMSLLTGGEFSRINFVRACIAHGSSSMGSG